MRKKPDIGLILEEGLSQFIEPFIKRELQQYEGLDFEIKIEKNKIWNCSEFALIGGIAFFILKSYFDGFLSEAGKNHYKMRIMSKNIVIRPKELKLRQFYQRYEQSNL